MCVRPVAPIAGAGRVDDLRIDLLRRFITKAQAVHDSRPEVLDDHIGGFAELLGDLPTLLALEIEGQAPRVAVGQQEKGAYPSEERVGPRPAALPSTPARRLDLDHVRAH